MINPDRNWFRLQTTALAATLGFAAAWILSVALIRPTLPFFPGDAATAEAAAAHRSAAGLAAWIGLIRGNLWTDYAMTLTPDPSGELQDKAPATSREALNGARVAAVRAAELAPYDARAWLLLAEVHLNGLDQQVAGPLKMSYYTGPNELSLVPRRINIATRSDAIVDPDLQILVGGEIRTIITRKPDLKPMIVTAYRSALPEGRRFIEMQVAALDPGLLASLRATNLPR
jgi:hypothetical protein